MVVPLAKNSMAGVTVIATSSAVLMVTDVEMETPPKVAVIVLVPTPEVMILPFKSTVAVPVTVQEICEVISFVLPSV